MIERHHGLWQLIHTTKLSSIAEWLGVQADYEEQRSLVKAIRQTDLAKHTRGAEVQRIAIVGDRIGLQNKPRNGGETHYYVNSVQKKSCDARIRHNTDYMPSGQ